MSAGRDDERDPDLVRCAVSRRPLIQRVEITKSIRVLWGAKPDGLRWIGWAVWDDHDEESCAVYRTKEEAVAAARELAREYANGER